MASGFEDPVKIGRPRRPAWCFWKKSGKATIVVEETAVPWAVWTRVLALAVKSDLVPKPMTLCTIGGRKNVDASGASDFPSSALMADRPVLWSDCPRGR